MTRPERSRAAAIFLIYLLTPPLAVLSASMSFTEQSQSPVACPYTQQHLAALAAALQNWSEIPATPAPSPCVVISCRSQSLVMARAWLKATKYNVNCCSTLLEPTLGLSRSSRT
ncbi:hypothetical protein PHLGIDRAFT_348472 [Phlebiopsis gigantea 11061_1 CR5-6]|uniref:Secreted protein n=1 Tax=Phlebiopsis gigantea (strain 11061_1 CR5-6) TaxID=745531 RepID=A0A0C3RZ04_PHLG1|nr:hypothetical protein PHLGIDRAFT_348472 [Phlebiopsis gigantea 11061_1 CR5-6]